MKPATNAALLSFLVPGAGLWYCGRRGFALLNLGIAILCPLIGMTLGFMGEHMLWVLLAVSAGSAGLAHAMASRVHAKR